jgi:hypothetical protein
MASPNSTPMMMIGITDSSGPAWCTPNRAPSHPHWCTATVAPKAAAIDSRKPPVAMSGTTMRAEDEQQDEDRQPHDDGEVGRQRRGESLRDLDVRHGLAGQAELDVLAPLELGCRELDAVERLGGRGVGRPGGGHDLEGQGRLVGADPERHDAAHARR